MSTLLPNGKASVVNLKIAPEQIRFRISATEFATLSTTGTLENVTQLGDGWRLDYTIHVNDAPSSSAGRILEFSTAATSTGTRLELTIFSDGIRQLQSGQAGKDGIREHLAFANGDLLSIGLEIDLHSKREAG